MPASKIKILVIEDERDLSFYLSNLLTGYGFDPVVVTRWKEALSTALSIIPAVIVMDAMLPGEATQNIYAEFKTNDALQHIPVVMLSSLTRRAFERFHLHPSGLPHGRLPEPEAVLPKPPEADEFIAVVRQLCALPVGDHPPCQEI